jgi:ribonuclease P/MRP protein subunit RPP1
VQSKVDPKKHTNYLDALLKELRPRQGIIYLKRITIVLDNESEKGFGLVHTHFLLRFP